MFGNHQLLVGRDDVAGDPRPLARNLELALRVRLGRQLEAKPRESLGDRRADGRRVLSDPRREHEAVDAAHGGGKHSGKQRDAVGEIVERKFGARIVARQKLAHVVADAG